MTDREFEACARRWGDTIYRVARHALGCRADAEDVCQSVLLKLYETAKEFESPEHVKHWLIRVTVNECRRLLRSPWRRRMLPLADYDAPVQGPEDESEVLAAVLALEAKYRLPVYLYYYEELPVREVAKALGVKESTVQTRLQRARERLRAALGDQGKEEEHG